MERRCPSRERKICEALLFASGEPVALKDIAKVLELSKQETEKILLGLMDEYEREEYGMIILRLEDRFQMCTNPVYYNKIEMLYKQQAEIRLTDTQLETLAIITYRQPVTRQEINDIRGVSSDGVVTKLMEMGLVEEAGRLRAPGRPLLLKTSEAFLKAFKLRSVKDMPHLPEPTQGTLENMDEPENAQQVSLGVDEENN